MTVVYDRILLPTDGSDTAMTAVEHALELADRYGADLHALYVVDVNALNVALSTEQVGRIEGGDFEDVPAAEKRAREILDTVGERALERGVDWSEEIRVGPPHVEIVDCAEEWGADLIVMGSHGRGGVRRYVMGSVTERVVRSTTLPVLVVDARDE